MPRTQIVLLAMLSLLSLGGLATVARAQTPPPSVEELYAQVSSSVVTLRTQKQQQVEQQGKIVTFTADGIGSGVLIDEGRILTAAHVVQSADEVIVNFVDGSEIRARVIAGESLADLAMLEIIGEVPGSVTPAVLGDSDVVGIGARVMVIGAPHGMSQTLTVGHLSARRTQDRILPGGVELEFLQTDAAINKGNSGGPMFNTRGEVIGIVSYILSRSGASAGLGFAVSAKTARGLLLDQHAFWGGVEHVIVDAELAAALNTPRGRAGALVQRVARRSAAAHLGIRGGTIPVSIAGRDILIGGDIILDVQGVEVGLPTSRNRINGRLGELGLGDTIFVTILRSGQAETLRYVIDERMSYFFPKARDAD